MNVSFLPQHTVTKATARKGLGEDDGPSVTPAATKAKASKRLEEDDAPSEGFGHESSNKGQGIEDEGGSRGKRRHVGSQASTARSETSCLHLQQDTTRTICTNFVYDKETRLLGRIGWKSTATNPTTGLC